MDGADIHDGDNHDSETHTKTKDTEIGGDIDETDDPVLNSPPNLLYILRFFKTPGHLTNNVGSAGPPAMPSCPSRSGIQHHSICHLPVAGPVLLPSEYPSPWTTGNRSCISLSGSKTTQDSTWKRRGYGRDQYRSRSIHIETNRSAVSDNGKSTIRPWASRYISFIPATPVML